MDDKPALLEMRDLRVGLGRSGSAARREVLHGIDLQVHAGRTLGIVGESGSGKSMTALAIMGLLPDGADMRGSIRLEGRELVGLPNAQLRALRGDRMAMVFQEPMTALNPLHTIGDQVAEPLRLHRRMGKRQALECAAALLERVGIAQARARLGAYPHQFSGGQRQRITIAMALACGPGLLIADEPTTALDGIVQRQILDLLDDLVTEDRMGMVLISHDLAVIAEYTDEVAIMTGGCIVESGATEQVFAHPQHPYTQQLLQSRQRLAAFLDKAIEQEGQDGNGNGNGHHSAAKPGGAAAPTVQEAA